MKNLTLLAGALAFTPGFALADMVISDAYARASNTKAGAAFMVIENTGDQDDRLLAVSSSIAARTELHTHQETGDGIMRMMHVEDGFAIPAGGTHMLKRGGDHVMFMGLSEPMEQGDLVPVTFVFEHAGDMMVHIPVDLERQDAHSGHDDAKDGEMDHSNH